MAKLTLRTPWTRQPQTPVGIDQKWIARGLVALFDQSIGRELISGDFAASSTAGRTAGRQGIARDYTSTANTQYAHRAAYAITGDISILVVCDVRALSNYGALVSKQASPTSACPYELRIGAGATDSVIDFARAGASNAYEVRTSANRFSAGFSGAFLATRSSSTVTDLTGNFFVGGAKTPLSTGAGVGSGAATDNGTSSVWLGRRTDGVTQLNGRIYFVALFNKVLSDAEAASLTINPWQLFAPQQRTLWVPDAAGGGTVYTLSPGGTITFSGDAAQRREHVQPVSGSIAFSGTAAQRYTRVFTPSGNVTFSGTVPLLRTRLQVPSGSIDFSGTAPFSQSNTYTLSPGGTITFSGTGNQVRERLQVPTGSLAFSGASLLLRERALVPTGGIEFTGTATETRIRIIAPTGQIVFSGTAPLIDPNAVGGVTTWRTLTGMGN